MVWTSMKQLVISLSQEMVVRQYLVPYNPLDK